MEEIKPKKRIRLGDIKKSGCCGPGNTADSNGSQDNPKQPCCPGNRNKTVESSLPEVSRVSTELSRSDRFEHLRCRISAYRMRYTINPGLYAAGAPDNRSDVFVSANYKMSFDMLRSSLKGMNAWILVLDTKGINVWCAAGKGTFGTDELIKRIQDARLNQVVSHRRVIAPQLGGPGIAAHTVKERTGFRVHYGPVYAKDIKAYVEAGYIATKEMRTVRFTFLDRLVLTPMEINPAMKKYPLYALLVMIVFGLHTSGISFKNALAGGLPFLVLGLVSIFAGAFLTPLFIDSIPPRSFALKGWIAGMVSTLIFSRFTGVLEMNPALQAFTYLFFPLVSSYLALQFTGSTTFTNISGVRKELRFAMPVYISAVILSVALLALFKLRELGVI